MPRLFIAIPIDEAIVHRLYEVAPTGQNTWRRVKPEALHLTLAFLGETEKTLIPRAIDAVKLATATAEPLVLNIEGVGAFPNERRARILWAGVTGDVEALTNLQSMLAAGLEEHGFDLEKRRYHPHITLARAREPGPLPSSLDRGARFGQWRATEIQLIESHLGAAGPRYEIRASAGLGGARDDDPGRH